jgi:hypothetical protein
MFMFFDGTLIDSNADTSAISYTLGTTLEFGRHGNGNGDYNFTGKIDEVRISRIDRSSTWTATEYNNQKNPGSFISVGSEEVSPCGSSSAWNPCNWDYRKKITIQKTRVTGAQTDFPVLINLSSDTDLATYAQDDGDDILFTSSDGLTQIPHEIESFSGSTGALTAWVKVPSVSSSADTDIYLYFGNSVTSSQQDPADVWDTNFKAVWHLKEDPSGTAPQMKDSTSSALHGTTTGGMTSGDQVAGRVGGSLDFDGLGDPNGDSVRAPDYDILNAITISAWINWDGARTDDGIVSKRVDNEVLGNWALRMDETTVGLLEWMVWDGVDSSQKLRSVSTIGTGSWKYVVLTFDDPNNTAKIYINGALDNSETSFSKGLANTPQQIAIGWSGQGGQYFDGRIDEVRLSNSIRSAQWIATEFANQNSPGTFYTVGNRESSPCAPPVQDPTWWNCLWAYRKNITINYEKVPSTQANFPVLVNLSSDNDLKYHARSDGHDIVFTDASVPPGTLSFERESYNPATGGLTAWVKVPEVRSLAPNTTIYMYYGYPSAPDMSHPTDTWDSSYRGVWHLDEAVTDESSAGIHYDSTSNANNGLQRNNSLVNGLVLGGQYFDKYREEWINVANSPTLNVTSQLTLEAWVKLGIPNNTQPVGKILSRTDGCCAGWNFGYERNSTAGKLHLYNEIWNTSGNNHQFRYYGVFDQETWTHLVVTWQTGGSIIEYVNGAAARSMDAGPTIIKNTSSVLRIAAEGSSTSPFEWFLNGTIDEARISNTVRPPDWILAEYNNMKDPPRFYTISSEASHSCGGTSGPYYVQSRSASYTSVSQAQITLPFSTTAGDLLVLSLVAPQSVTVSSVIDSRNGNAYNLALAPTNVGAWGRLSTYYVSNSLGGGPITATVTLTGTATTLNVSFLEYSGVAMASPVDQTSAGSSSGTAMDSGSKTITQAPSLIYGFGAGDHPCHGTSPYVDRETANARCAVDQTVPGTGTYNVIATQDAPGGAWALQMVAFKGA